MTDFVDHDLSGSHFERVNLRDATMRRVDLSGIEIRGAALHGARLIGIEMADAEITGELRNVTINGVDIGPLVEAELDRRMPDRVKMRPTDADGFREAWATLERLWDGTIGIARTLAPASLHERVNGEWSFIETLRHLGFASAAWVGRMVLGDPSPWHPLDLPWDEAPGWDGIPWDREARPALDDVMAVRSGRWAMVAGVVDALTDEQLASKVSCAEPGWPRIEQFPFAECLLIVLTEEWEHRLYAERDLAALSRR
jgi:hypothetical protein